MELYQYLARQIYWQPRGGWADEKGRRIAKAMSFAPSGSGFDAGTVLSDESTGEKLVFTTEYHHMNESGFYDGWTSHNVVVRPSLLHGFVLTVSGRDRNGIKDYIHDCFYEFLRKEVDEKTF